jgi:predicted transposase/invertase (TIGR01784 family)
MFIVKKVKKFEKIKFSVKRRASARHIRVCSFQKTVLRRLTTNLSKELFMESNNQNPVRYEWGPFPLGNGKTVLDIRYDPVFKAVFTKDTKESRGALSHLISALIGRTVNVETIIANEPPVDDLRQRYLRFDVACRTEDGELVNVEMSLNPNKSERVRLEYHVAKLFVGQNIHGEDKNYNDLKETYQIAILAKTGFFLDEELIHNFIYYDPDTCISLSGRTKIITVELAKTKPIVDKPIEEMTNAELWAVFLEYLTDEGKRAKMIEIINHEEGIAMAVETLSNITQDEVEYARMCNLIKSQLDYQSGMVEARRSGIKEGREEGLKEGMEIAHEKDRRYFLELINQGLSIEEIKERLIDN